MPALALPGSLHAAPATSARSLNVPIALIDLGIVELARHPIDMNEIEMRLPGRIGEPLDPRAGIGRGAGRLSRHAIRLTHTSDIAIRVMR